ncbi:uncharacterized protein LOC143869142 [Tasmannia lanceolata]|uniref:uncharacterized protein LOC143869142 n=1 Tax=Tasmannia lanceolata TaxID=3420 RepID=UPI0040639E42
MESALSKSANQFAVDLFQCYLKRHGDKYKNLLLCPYLIFHSLAMMLVGAKGNTALQLHNLLRIPKIMTPRQDPLNTPPCANSASATLGSGRPRCQISRSPSLSSSYSSCSSTTSLTRCSRRKNKTSTISPNAAPSVSPHTIEQSLGKSRSLTPDGTDEPRHREFLWLTEQLIHGNHEFVHLASFIYLDKGTKRTERYKNVLRDYYETKPKKIDFDNIDLMVKTINEDVARTTENIYNDILSRLEAQKLEKSYMLLVNAVFFRGFWLSNFTDVKKGPFFKSSSPTGSLTARLTTTTAPESPQEQQQQTIQVNMMSKLDYLPVLNDEQLDARIVMMPFEASDLQMIIILPNNKLSDSTYLCQKISATKLDSVIELFLKSKCKTVRISMPIFCVDSGKISIQSTLVQMGASDLFDKKKANMSGVCENKAVWLHKILHRCFIICDNRGAITSSSSEKAKRRQAKQQQSLEASVGITTGRSGVDDFVADHPFMYIIFDSVTRTILLIGLYTDPVETLEVIHENQLSPEEAHQIYTEGVYKT